MKTLFPLAILALLVAAPVATPSDAQAAGWKRHHGGGHRAHHRRKRPHIRPSSAREPGGRCGKLNLEKARLYGLCR